MTRKKPKRRGPKKPAEKEELIRFVALPMIARKKEFGFVNLQDFAKVQKIHPGTISDWLAEEEVQKRIRNKWKAWGKDKTPDVIQGLYKSASEGGKASEVMAWMKIIEDWVEKTNIKVEGNVLHTLLLEISNEEENPIKKENGKYTDGTRDKKEPKQ